MKKTKPLYAPRYWPIWFICGIFWCIVQLPHRWRLAIGRGLGRLAMSLSAKARHVTFVNIDKCFPKLTNDERKKLVKKSFESTGMGLIEAGMAWWLPDFRLKHLYKIVGAEHGYKALEQGKGVILLGLHLSSLEIAGRLSTFFEPFHAMYQTSKNPVIDWIMLNYRQKIYKKVIANNNIRGLLKCLQANEIIWYAPDQSASSKHSAFVPFFGVQTATSTATNKIAKLSGAPILPAAHYRNPDYSGYTMVIHPPLENFPTDDDVKDTARINEHIEAMIRVHPEQYLWQYKRFKRRPIGDADFYAERETVCH